MRAELTITIQAQVAWRVSQSATNRWVAVCDELNMATEGCSLDEVHSLIQETMDLLFTDLVKDNEFDTFLRERGWSTQTPLPRDAKDVGFDLPWQMITDGGRDFEHRPN